MFYKLDGGKVKGIRLEELPESAWRYIGGNDSGNRIDKIYSAVSWVYRCVNLRANGVASMPFAVRQRRQPVAEFDGITFTDDPPPGLEWVAKLPGLLKRVEAAVCLGGAAYLERRRNLSGRRTLGFDWLLPRTIAPRFDTDTGEVLAFDRAVGGQVRQLRVEDVVYFWLSDHTVETGASKQTPARAALSAAGVLYNVDAFLEGYFERGMVKATLLKYQDAIMPEEASRVKEWWRRVFSGVKNAHAAEVVRGDFDTLTIGDGISDLGDNALTVTEREAIATAFGVPQSKVTANAANFATKQGDDVMFIEDTIIPEIGWIYATVNEQMMEAGYNIVALPERLRIMQIDENARAGAFADYVGGGMSVEAAVAVLGIDVPEGVPLVAETPAPPAPAQATTTADQQAEAGRLRRWLKRRGTTDITRFESDILSNHDKAAIAIEYVRQTGGVKDALKAMQPDIDLYTQEMQEILQNAVDEEIDRDEAILALIAIVTQRITKMFRAEIGILDGPLPNDAERTMNNLIHENSNRVRHLVDDAIAAARVDADTEEEGNQHLLAIFRGRLPQWGLALLTAVNLGRIYSDAQKLTWHLGATERHCTTCLEQNGQSRTPEEWQALHKAGIYPQSRALECGGWRCDCSIS